MYISIFWGDFHLPIKFVPEATMSGDTLCLTVVPFCTSASTTVIYSFLGRCYSTVPPVKPAGLLGGQQTQWGLCGAEGSHKQAWIQFIFSLNADALS